MAEKFERPSDTFMSVVCDGGTPCADCELCGRTHFATNDRSAWRDGEIEAMRAKAEAAPEKYVESSDDGVGFGWIDGKQVVWGCPCNQLSRYENFIWRHRHMILEYIRERNKQERAAADHDADALGAAVAVGAAATTAPGAAAAKGSE